MTVINIIKIICISSIILLTSCHSNNGPQPVKINDPKLLKAAESLPKDGVLKIDKDYVYLKVSDDYQKNLYPLLIQNLSADDSKCLVPEHSSLGSHISVFYEGDLSRHEINSLPTDKIFDFRILEIAKITIVKKFHHQWETTIWYVVMVDSKTLSSIVNQMILTKFYKLSPFHISIGIARYKSDGSCLNVGGSG
jgi:hypothetical protein